MGSHVMGGKFTTLEGLLRNVLDQIEQNPLYGGALAVGDSATPDSKLRLTTFKNQLNKMIEGEAFPYILILDDPAGNSYLQVSLVIHRGHFLDYRFPSLYEINFYPRIPKPLIQVRLKTVVFLRHSRFLRRHVVKASNY